MLPETLIAVLGALPFLPRGKGAAILILGGMALLAFSLCWSMLVLRSARSRARNLSRPSAGRRHPTRAAVARRPSPVLAIRAPWLVTLLATTVRSGIGDPEIIAVEPYRQVLRLEDCRACRGRRGAHGCERERAALERVLRAFSPDAEVTEIACNTEPRGACTFELVLGALQR